MNTNDLSVGVIFMFFSFWPLIWIVFIMNFLQSTKKVKAALKNAFFASVTLWVLFFMIRIWMLIIGQRPSDLFIKEPLSTSLFILSGFVFLLIIVITKTINKSKDSKKREGINALRDLQALSPLEFEKVVADTYNRFGHQAKQVGNPLGDHGIDVVVKDKNGLKLVVQCKRWKGKVGEPVVRDLYGAMMHEKADRAALITTGTFTHQAEEWAKGKPILLYDGNSFLKVIKKSQKKSNDVQYV